jgi:hypothetical protein
VEAARDLLLAHVEAAQRGEGGDDDEGKPLDTPRSCCAAKFMRARRGARSFAARPTRSGAQVCMPMLLCIAYRPILAFAPISPVQPPLGDSDR